MTVLKATDIRKTFRGPKPLEVLKGVSISVEPGESIAIMGRSGEGKSTLLQILGTLDIADKGSLLIKDQPVSHSTLSKIRSRNIGFIFQSFHLLEDFTVLQNVLMPARIARESVKKGSKFYKHAEELIDFVGLKDHAHQIAKQLSGGEKQRVAIARALCNNPDIILADEPTGNLDHSTAEMIHSLLIDLAGKQGRSLIIVTHNQDLANLCDKQYLLLDGLLQPSQKNS
jgi:lipoprotein-releasing system ATP-binding protein